MSLAKTFLQWSGLMIGYVSLSSNSSVRNRSFIKMVDLSPPLAVKGLKNLDRDLFMKTVNVPCLKVKSESVNDLRRLLKKYVLKVRNCKAIRTAEGGGDGREVLLDPKAVTCYEDISSEDRTQLEQLGVSEACLGECSLQLTYDNWMADDVLTAVLPEGVETAASYSLIGHIVHVNLREHLHDYKHVIGQVLLDKIKNARTVVNKVDTIDSTFRVFNMEVLAGDADFVTEVKENTVRYKFDFSRVYWNPRLSTEHERIVKKLNPGNILYDVFAGVGPFSVPAAKKKCIVLANDLNPESHKWLQHNVKLNKVEQYVQTYNKDGADFIKEDVKRHLLEKGSERQAHIVMNLPALAVTFLPVFKQLMTTEQLMSIKTPPLTHVYCFVKGEGDPKEMARKLVENELNCSISDAVDEISFVRNVAPNKDMMRVSFRLIETIVQGGKRKLETGSYGTESKKSK